MYSEQCKSCIVEGCPDSCSVKINYKRDFERVVRCKDCKYYHKEWDGTEKHHHEDYWCEWVEPDENDFCSLAERRSDED